MKKILIVEDDKKIVTALTIRLQAAGYEVVVSYDAALAMTRAMDHQPDLALLDITMPGGNGFVVAERLRDSVDTASIPIIFLTASKQPGLREKALELGAVAFFEKPYDAQRLLATIAQALEDAVYT
jgi:CheY-like chemotaxis protein